MSIPASTVHIVPAVSTPEKVFAHTWVRHFEVRSYGVDQQSYIYIELVPYNEDTGEIDHSNPREIRLPLWALINHVDDWENPAPNAAAIAMGAVFAAIPWIEEYATNIEE